MTPTRSVDDTMPAELAPVVRERSTFVSRAAVTISGAAVLSTVVATRIWVIISATLPKGPDVLGPWANAFFLSGADPRIDMRARPPYSVGMGMFLAPLVRSVGDPLLRYRIAIGLIAGLVVLTGWATGRISRRLNIGGRFAAHATAVTVVGLPAIGFSSSFSWVEPLAYAWLAVCLLVLFRTVARPTTANLVVSAVYCGTVPLVHGRFTFVPVTWIAAHAVFVLLDRRGTHDGPKRRFLPILTNVVVTSATYAAVSQFRLWVISNAWSQPNMDSDTSVLPHIGDPLYWRGVFLGAAGQLWYMVASTFGLGLLGLYALARVAFTEAERTDDDATTRRWLAGLTLAVFTTVFVVCVLFVATELIEFSPGRLDYLIYGRYADPVFIMLAGIGAAELLRMSRRRALTSGVVTAGVTVLLFGVTMYVRSRSGQSDFAVNAATIAGVASMPFDRPGLDLTRWTMVAGFGLVTLVAARLVSRSFMVLLLAAMLCATTIFGANQAVIEHGLWDNSTVFRGYPTPPATMARALVADDTFRYLSYQFNFPAQQYVLAAKGWKFELVHRSSSELTRHVPEDVGMVVVREDAGPPVEGEWCTMPLYDRNNFWIRLGPIAEGEPGGDCVMDEDG